MFELLTSFVSGKRCARLHVELSASLQAQPMIAVQVLTRFLTSSPVMYWYMAELVLHGPPRVGNAVVAYVSVWSWTGLVLFPNFYPWT
jgi:hypothetical protein